MDPIRIEVTVRVDQATTVYERKAIASSKQELEGIIPLSDLAAEVGRMARLAEGEALRQLGITMEQKRLEETKRLVAAPQ